MEAKANGVVPCAGHSTDFADHVAKLVMYVSQTFLSSGLTGDPIVVHTVHRSQQGRKRKWQDPN